MVAVAIYAFMTAWGEVLFASVLTDESTTTLAIGLQQLPDADQRLLEPGDGGVAGRSACRWWSASCCLQRFLVAGLTAGAVKS